MADVFISYAREDHAFVRLLDDALAREKRASWVDWQGIPPTAEWLSEIRRAIESSHAAVFVISPSWIASRVCLLELEHAVKHGKRLIPILHRDVPDGSVPDALARLNWVTLRDGDDFDAGVIALFRALDTDLDWVRSHTRLLVRANEWQSRGQEDSALLRGPDLEEAERWLVAGATHRDPTPTVLQSDYIARSRKAATRRQRILLVSVAGALVVAVGLAIWAMVERDVAQAQRDEAVRQTQAAQARQLAARAQLLQGSDPALAQKAVLLAAESLNLLPNVEADQVLRRVLGQLTPRIAELPHGGILEPTAVAGADPWLLIADRARTLRLIDIRSRREIFHKEIGKRIERVAMSWNSRFIAAAVRGLGVLVIDRISGREATYECDGHALAFHGPMYGGADLQITEATVGIPCGREVLIVDLVSWKEVRRLEMPGTPIAVAFSRDGKLIAALNDEADVRVWDSQGNLVATIRGQDPASSTRWSYCCIGFLAFSPNGRHLVSTNLQQHEVRVLSTGDWTRTALRHDAPVYLFSFDDDYRDLIVTGGTDGSVRVWDLRSRRMEWQASHAAEITHLRLRRRGREFVVVSASTDRTARIWPLAPGRDVAWATHVGPVVWADLATDRELVSVDQYSRIGFWAAGPKPVPFRIFAPQGRPATLAACADAAGDLFAFATPSGGVGLSKDLKRVHRLFFRTRDDSGATFSPNCRWLALAGQEGLEVYSPATRKLVHQEKGYFSGRMSFSSSGGYLLYHPHRDGGALWSTQSWSRVPLAEDCKARDLMVSPDERHVGYRCGEEFIVKETGTWKEVGRTDVKAQHFWFSTQSAHVIAITSERISLLELPSLKEVHASKIPTAVKGVRFAAPDGRYLAAAGDNVVVVWELPELRLIAREAVATETRGPQEDSPLALSADGNLIMSFGRERLVLHQLNPWSKISELWHQGSVKAVALDRVKGQVAAVMEYHPAERPTQYAARIWGIKSGAQVSHVDMDRPSRNIALSSDGRYLLADQLYLRDPSALIAAACQLLTRNLTKHEWSLEMPRVPYAQTCAELPVPPTDTPQWER
jgi:WD40 repeat protein